MGIIFLTEYRRSFFLALVTFEGRSLIAWCEANSDLFFAQARAGILSMGNVYASRRYSLGQWG